MANTSQPCSCTPKIDYSSDVDALLAVRLLYKASRKLAIAIPAIVTAMLSSIVFKYVPTTGIASRLFAIAGSAAART